MKNKIVIFGINDLAELAHFYFQSEYEPFYGKDELVIGFTVNKEYNLTGEFKGLPVWDWEDLEHNDGLENILLFAPIANNKLREKIYIEGKRKGYEFISYISSKCTNFSKSIGENCFILEDNIIQPFTSIGNNVILWSGNHIGHHGIIEDNVFFTSHVVMSGHCHIKQGAFLGVNSCIRDGVTIGENSIIGMGSVVTKNVPDNETWIGSPAKNKI